MKQILLLLAALLALPATAPAVDGYVTKTATGTTQAAVHFPAGSALRIVGIDVTSDKAASKLNFCIGTQPATVAAPAAAGSTFIVFKNAPFITNQNVILQTSAENCTNVIVATNGSVTHKLVYLGAPLGTNLAAGDTVNRRLNVAYTTPVNHTATDTTIFVNATNGLAASDVIVADLPTGVWKATLSAVAKTTNRAVLMVDRVADALAVNDQVWRQTTNVTTVLSTLATNGTGLNVATTTGFTNNCVVVIDDNGALDVVAVSSVSTTNLTIAALGHTVSSGAGVFLLDNATLYTNKFPVTHRTKTLILDKSDTIAAGDKLIAKPATGFTWRGVVDSVSATNLNVLTLSGALGVALYPDANLYKLTNSHAVSLAALNTDSTVTLNNVTNLTAGDVLIFSPATGGAARNVYLGSDNSVLTTVGFTGAIGLAVAAGDQGYYAGVTNSIPVGSATVRRDGAAIIGIPSGRPVRVVLDGTSSCTINAVTGKYD